MAVAECHIKAHSETHQAELETVKYEAAGGRTPIPIGQPLRTDEVFRTATQDE